MSPAVLVRLVEIITGQRYLEALQQRLFSPPGHANCSSLARI